MTATAPIGNETVTLAGEFNLLGLDRGGGQSTSQCLRQSVQNGPVVLAKGLYKKCAAITRAAQ